MDITNAALLGAILQADDTPEAETAACPMPVTKLPQEMPYAMAYVPFQQWQKPYDCDAALERGTAFP